MKTSKITIVTVTLALCALISDAHADQKNQQVVAPEFLKPAPSREFTIEYVGKISAIPAGAKVLRVWLPVPQNSTVQSIKDLSFTPQFTHIAAIDHRRKIHAPGSLFHRIRVGIGIRTQLMIEVCDNDVITRFAQDL
jgi:hypothetical protein